MLGELNGLAHLSIYLVPEINYRTTIILLCHCTAL
uniref:Uncharacterized protein n=1 Tax=Arundo donax TaxID=35708 RepID=A0A0A9GT99_ARUDO